MFFIYLIIFNCQNLESNLISATLFYNTLQTQFPSFFNTSCTQLCYENTYSVLLEKYIKIHTLLLLSRFNHGQHCATL